MGDLISRQDAINTALEFFVEFLGGAFHEDDQKILMKRMNDLPSVEPELDPCDFCKHKDDCGYMMIYCPAERKGDKDES